MVDNVSATVRSRVMRATKAQGNLSTELTLIRALRRLGISGWRRHLFLPGRPDFAFRKERLAVFVDGCYWHGCPLHCRMPASNFDYWHRKIGNNVLRDKKTNHALKLAGWAVLRIWEHELKADPGKCGRQIQRCLRSSFKMRASKPRPFLGSPKNFIDDRPTTNTRRD